MAKIVGAARVSPQFQVSIPVKVREYLKIEAGDTIAFVVDDDGEIRLKTDV